MEKETPSFYAIIPANVRYDKELKANSKLMFGEITALSNKQGYCWASNKYFADLYEVTPQAISNWIKLLEKKGYVRIEYIREGKEIKQRNIYIEVSTNIDRGINKSLEGYQQKFKESTTSFNNTINKNIYDEVFNYYISKDNLIKHKKLVLDMNKAIDKAIKLLSLDLDYIKRIIDRHSDKVKETKNSDFPIKARTISELFGQAKFKSTSLICSDYLDELYTNESKVKEEPKIFEIKRGAI